MWSQVEARQKVVQSNEEDKEEDADKEKEKIDEDASGTYTRTRTYTHRHTHTHTHTYTHTVNACYDKAMFLLKFSGLSRRKDSSLTSGSRPSWAIKNSKWQKVTTAVSTVGVLKKHVSIL